VPIAHCREIIEKYFPRSLRGTISATITYVRATRPPPPIPWTHLPASKTAILLATEQMMVPSVKKNSAVKRTDFRPMICENDAQDG